MSQCARGSMAALLLLAGSAAGLGAQDGAPAGWRWTTDRPARLVSGQAVPDSGWRFVAMPPGWHITMGPGGVLYDPGHRATGRFVLEAETFLFPEKTEEGFGLFVGGRNLDQAPEYVAFVIRPDGRAAVVRAGATPVTLVDWTPADSIKVQDPSDAVRNVLRVAVERDSVTFSVNGGRVAALPRAAGEFEGYFGFRVGAGVNLHISTLDFTRRIAPPRRGSGG
jgi:hypothetical protein